MAVKDSKERKISGRKREFTEELITSKMRGSTEEPMDMGAQDQHKGQEQEHEDTHRIPENEAFWKDAKAMYQLASEMEKYVIREPESEWQQQHMDIVKARGESIVQELGNKLGQSWDALKQMSEEDRDAVLTTPKPIKPTTTYANIVSSKKHEEPPQGSQFVRLRCSFTGAQDQRSIASYATQVRKFLKSILMMGRIFDKTMSIAPWDSHASNITMKEIQGLSDEAIGAYIKMPADKYMLKGRVNMIGVRLISKAPGWEIVRNFAVLRYRNKQADSSIIVKEASVHNGPQGFRLGYFQGTSPNGDYTTFRKEIKETTDCKVEITWQNVYVRGVTGKIWDMAKKEASKVGDSNSSEYKRRKFQLSPEGLEAHVRDREEIKPMKAMLMKKYGKRVQIADGSVVRFIPFATKDTSMSSKMKSKLTKRLAWQSIAKAGEEKFPVSITDIYEEKEYLQGKSLEQVIHEMEATGLRIFRHIGIRWNNNLKANDYDLIAHSSMVREAAQMVEQLKHYMFEYSNGDPRIWNHFLDGARNLSDSAAAAKMQLMDDPDEEVNAFYDSDEDSMDDALESQLLSPGFIQILQAQQGQEVPYDDSSTMYDTKTTNTKGSTGSDESTHTVKSILTTDSNRTTNTGISGITWDEGVQDNKKKSSEETIDGHLRPKIKDWKAFTKWRDEERKVYEGVCASRSTNITKATSVLKLYFELLKKRKLKETKKDTKFSSRAAAADDPGQGT